MIRPPRHVLNWTFIKQTLQLTYSFVNRIFKRINKKCDILMESTAHQRLEIFDHRVEEMSC
jgi:hypothetical protein